MVSSDLMMAGDILAHMIGPLISRLTSATVIIVAAQHGNEAATRHVEARAIEHDVVTEALSQAFDMQQQRL